MTQINSQLEPSQISMELIKTELDNQEVYAYDFKSLSFDDLKSFAQSNPDAFTTVNVDANHSVESVAKKLYDDASYFDLILLLNNRDMIEDMPKSTDLLVDEVEDETLSYFKNYQGNIPSFEDSEGNQKTLIDVYLENKLQQRTEENVQNQTFLVLKPEYKKQFLRTTRYKI